jgi:hypothetical protein
MEGLGESPGVGNVGDEWFRTFGRERLQMSGVSANYANFLSSGEKLVRHYMSGVAACSEYNEHRLTSIPGLDARGEVSTQRWF